MTDLTSIGLFAGIGGLELAAEAAGFRTIALCEKDKDCQKVLLRNFPGVPLFESIETITQDTFEEWGIEAPTLVAAGVPCQPFSVSGLRRGTSDSRYLWPEAKRVVRILKPKWFVVENVAGLLSSRSRRLVPKKLAAAEGQARAQTALGIILSDMAQMGFHCGWGVWGADEACEAPHRRDRIFIIGHMANRQSQRSTGLGLPDLSRLGDPDSYRGGAELDDATSLEDNNRFSRGAQRRPAESGAALAHPGHKLGQGRQAADFSRRQKSADRAPRLSAGFPPRPGDTEAWRWVAMSDPRFLPAVSREAEAELQICPKTDGISRRMALRMLGNAVVPAQAFPIFDWIANYERSQVA